ncbi:kinesin motor protein CIN8 [Saccharomyces eubayanus]|uniref:kinesin motor protein CIN8 n=1 Tax=Saccharomyces eubayanus TaxID=1080349 RepID=UPI0006C6684C|nr:CIN8-like protein [Saccharomyces eubayanus]KOG99888.1 CIN8-like protein [Saccharomyces eubayanus]
MPAENQNTIQERSSNNISNNVNTQIGCHGVPNEELNITVAVRCRGRNEREIGMKSSVVVNVPDITGSEEVSINTTGDTGITAQMNAKRYTVDKVFGPGASQDLIFDEVAGPLFQDFIKGYNCTVLVYGMTSTGKTYTMTGDEKLYNGELSDAAGIIPRVLLKLFDTLELQQNDYVVKCSFIELYNEELKDLLDNNSNNSSNNAFEGPFMKKLRIFDSSTANNTTSNSASSSRSNSRNSSPRSLNDLTPKAALLRKRLRTKSLPNTIKQQHQQQHQQQTINSRNNSSSNSGSTNNNIPGNTNTNNSQRSSMAPNDQSNGIYIQNLQEFHITNAMEGLNLLQRGLKHRQVASTKMNDFSSRSHTIFTITLYKKHQDELFRISKMNLVDLAGSENINRSGALNQRAKEAGSINQSLLTLGRVINALADKSGHIPFRESKLTRLLQDSLGGNTKTALIATISPAKVTSEETCSTLEYASKAKNIKNKPQLGAFIMKDILVKNITMELAKIKSDLLSTKSKEGIYMSQDHYKNLNSDLESYKNEVQECKRDIESLSSKNSLLLKDKLKSKDTIQSQNSQMESLKVTINQLKAQLDKQHKTELEISGFNNKLQKLTEIMQLALQDYKRRELDLNKKFETHISKEIKTLKTTLFSQLSGMEQKNISQETNIQPNLDIIKNEVLTLMETMQEKAELMYKDCVKKILNESPKFFNVIVEKIDIIRVDFQRFYNNIAENLSDISEENNNLKQYLKNHFFKNNHQELLNHHIDSTYENIEKKTSEFVENFKNTLNDHLEENKKLIMQNLTNATSAVINQEMDLFEPKRVKWENSFDLINKCDSMNNEFYNNMATTLSQIKSTVDTSSNSMNKSISVMKGQVEESENAVSLLKNNKKFNDQFKQLVDKHTILKDNIENSITSTHSHITNVDDIYDTIENIMKNYGNKENAAKNEMIDNILKEIPSLSKRIPLRLSNTNGNSAQNILSPKKHAIDDENPSNKITDGEEARKILKTE